MSYSCDWVIYPLPSKTQSYVASVILNEYRPSYRSHNTFFEKYGNMGRKHFYFFAFRENAENILPNTVAVSGL